ncbi:hypothetical protein MMC19_002053 [Ptychographa xylographoides]|nr:hypothetical protein [Ptychographa xylographoides]
MTNLPDSPPSTHPTSPSAVPSSPTPQHKSKKRSISPSAFRKACTLCETPRDVLVRCRIDETQAWHFVCPGKCWNSVSGGVIDGPTKPHYRYGGMWKNKHAGVSAKKPSKRKGSGQKEARSWSPGCGRYTANDLVKYGGQVWICRRSHESTEKDEPGAGHRYWKEYGKIVAERSGDDIDGQFSP